MKDLGMVLLSALLGMLLLALIELTVAHFWPSALFSFLTEAS